MNENLEKNNDDGANTLNNNEETNNNNKEAGFVELTPGTTSKSIVIKILVAISLVAVLAIGTYFSSITNKNTVPAQSTDKIVRIGLSLDTLKTQRWAVERDIMTKKALEKRAVVTTLVAEGDDIKQISQIENFISQKVDVIIVVPHDTTALNEVLGRAQSLGIKVINYDRLTQGSRPDLYLSFDSIKVGEVGARYVIDAIPGTIEVPNIAYFAGSRNDNNTHLVSAGVMSVLQPLLDSGKINLVYNEFTTEWSPDVAFKNLKAFLDDGGQVDAVVTASDALAYGVIQALAEHGLAGKVPVSGQDGELQAMQRMLKGTQTVSAYKPGRLLAEMAIVEALRLANGQEPEINAAVNNGLMEVPSYLIDPIPVTKANIDSTVIADGTYTRSQIYTNQ
jgi:D-xylose transport system substrate-binding protein